MSITYTGAGGLFTRLGKLVKAYNLLATYQTSAASAIDEVLDEYASDREILPSFQQSENMWEATVGSVRVTMIDAARTTVEWAGEDLDMPVRDFDAVAGRLIEDMYSNSESVNANAVASGAVSAGGSNVGDGLLFATSMIAETAVEASDRGRPDERIIAETVRLTCVSDGLAGGTEGSEEFTIEGELPRPDVTSVDDRGSGSGPSVTVMFAEGSPNLLTNGSFEDWTDSAPDDWTAVGGSTCVAENTSLKVEGSSCVEMVGESTIDEISITQALDSDDIQPNTTYFLAGWFRTSGLAATSTAKLEVTGTGFTAAAEEVWTDSSTFAESAWTAAHFFFHTPRDVPSDLSIKASLTGTNITSAEHLYIDCVTCAEAVSHGGCRYGLLRGETDFVRGDYFTHTKTNDLGGVFQKFFADVFDLQLPSDDSGAETIGDSLAT